MRKKWFLTLVFIFVCLLGFGQIDRSEVDEKYKWDLTDIYSSYESWEKSKNNFVIKLNNIQDFKGTLTQSSEQLLAALEYYASVNKELARLRLYASLNSASDTREMKYSGMVKELQQITADLFANASFFKPEILESEWKLIEGFIKSEPKLKLYEKGLKDIFRLQEHTLSESEEKIIALSRMITGNAYSIYNTFTNAEMPYPIITLSDGQEVNLSKAGYSKYRAIANRSDRELVFETFWENYQKYQASLGEMLYGNVKSDLYNSKVRNYESALESSLYPKGIPVDVYHSHIDNINKNMPAFHRYLEIKKRMMGLDTLKYLDLYAPAVKGIDMQFSYDESQEIILKALEPLGEDYINIVETAFNERWIDVYPTLGKRSGAFSNGAFYDGHPYILLNFNGLYEDVGTAAHELGHTMHSYLSNKNQAFPSSRYEIFVAEVASTFNEVLLFNYVLSTIKDDDVRLSFLMTRLNDFKGTLFRQTQFAEFELRIHEATQKGVPLTGGKLSEIYTEIVHKYYGHDKGICNVNDYINMEWAYIPHFYYNFYVYQYSTSFIVSNTLATKVLDKEEGALERYLEFLSAGGSDYPIELLKKAGVDFTNPDTFSKTIELMNNIMDEIEKILDKKGI
ncbi:MAG: oligoendopeptidase F [Bacteroidales bacterium]|jgi:oligoendopeptidase F|nr:oligoendopeptidase F [Bacteroidales bacterium]